MIARNQWWINSYLARAELNARIYSKTFQVDGDTIDDACVGGC